MHRQILLLWSLLLGAVAIAPEEFPSEHYQRPSTSADASSNQKKNVLLVIADDMRAEASPFIDATRRPWLHADMRTPHLAELAARSLVLRQAFAQETRCNPSRSSFLTGRRPDSTRIHNNHQFFRAGAGQDVITLPQYFRKHGYRSIGFGKIFHSVLSVTPHVAQDNDWSWSRAIWDVREPYNVEDPVSWMAVSPDARKQQPLKDDVILDLALAALEERSTAFKVTHMPFFMAVGFRKPHMPFVCPEEYFDLYPLEEVTVPQNEYSPSRMPAEAWYASHEVLNYADTAQYRQDWAINSTLPHSKVRQLRRAYYACVSYVDDLIGTLLTRLEELRLRENTVVIFVGDHGWHLGENGIWGKTTNFEAATHAPVMVSIPGRTDRGMVSDHLVELVDIFPTVVEAAGLPPPPLCPRDRSRDVALCTEGTSWLPLVDDPNTPQWKGHVFSQYPWPDSKDTGRRATHMGYSLRTHQFRYNEWVNYTTDAGSPSMWSVPRAVELYDLLRDPLQTSNLAYDPQYADVRTHLSVLLHRGWQGALPDAP